MWDGIVNGFLDAFFRLFYLLLVGILKILDFFVLIFQYLAGVGEVNIEGEAPQTIPEYMFNYPTVRNAFWLVLGVGFVLMTLFTIIAIIRSNYQQNKNWRSVLGQTAKGGFAVILVPFCITLGLLLTSAVTSSIQMAISGGGTPQSLGGTFLNSMVLDVVGSSRAGEVNAVFGDYLSLGSGKDYGNIDQVGESLKEMGLGFRNLGYTQYTIGGIVLLLALGLSAFGFIKRLYNLLLLYILSPVVGSTYPLDDGERFKAWVGLVVSTMLSALGTLLIMNLYIIFIPIFNKVSIPGMWDPFNTLFRLSLIVAGGFAVLEGSKLIAQLTGGEQSDTGHTVKKLMFGKAMAGLTKKAVSTGWKATKATGRATHRGWARFWGGQRARDFVAENQKRKSLGIPTIKNGRISSNTLENLQEKAKNLAEESELLADLYEKEGNFEEGRKEREKASEYRADAKRYDTSIKWAKRREFFTDKYDAWVANRRPIGHVRGWWRDTMKYGWAGGFDEKNKQERRNNRQYGRGKQGSGHMSDAEVEAKKQEAKNRGYSGTPEGVNDMRKDDIEQQKSKIKSDNGEEQDK